MAHDDTAGAPFRVMKNAAFASQPRLCWMASA